MDLLLEVFNHTHTQQNHEEDTHTHNSLTIGRMQFKYIKLDFPRFYGKNTMGWIYKVNHYFILHFMSDS